ncbi:MAG TPA: DUF1631 family protein [Usitatibacter sp.]|nr:DUF1631 family protein [Usitatibacter sp.]
MAQSSSGNVVSLDHARVRSRLTPVEAAQELHDCRSLALERLAFALASMLDHVEDELSDMADHAPDRAGRELYLDARSQARARRHLVEAAFREHFVELFNRKARGEFRSRGNADAPREAGELRRMSRRLQSACEAELVPLGQRLGLLVERPSLEGESNPAGPATVCAALEEAWAQLEADQCVRIGLLRQLDARAETELRGIYRDLNAHLAQRRILPAAAPGPRGDATQPLVPLAEETQPLDLFAVLVQLRRGPGPAAREPSEAALEVLTRMHRDCAAVSSGTLVNELRSLPAVLREGEAALDRMTLDLCAMLFDQVFADRHIPTVMKSQMGRLQIPVLKAVLLDPSFFSRRAHPARRLLDVLAEVGLGLVGEGPAVRAALDLVEDVGDRILAQLDRDAAVFDTMAAMAETFMAANEEADASLVRRAAAVVETRERGWVAAEAGRAEVERRLAARTWVPAPVRQMLIRTWSGAFASVHGVEGEGSPPWQKLARTMDDLLWSVEPKVAPEDRRRLVATLPAMLADVAEGLQRAQMAPEERDAFLATLVDCHALAVKAGMRGMAVVPEFPPAPPAFEEARLEREVLEAGDVRVEEVRFDTPPGAAVRGALARTGQWLQVQRGSWVEFAPGDAPAFRARLAWMSPGKSAYLFTNPLTGDTAISITPEALAEQMRRGQARMLDDAPLVARALDALAATLRDKRAAARSPSP